MQNEEQPVANRNGVNLVQYVCHGCGGWYTLVGTSTLFLPFVDHLIGDLCFLEHPKLKNRRLVGDQVWFQLSDTNEMICGLPPYKPESEEWMRLLENGQKILPQARFFLPDIADWLKKALGSLEALNSITTSDVLTAERLAKLVGTLPPAFEEQRGYLLDHREQLDHTGMDPKWLTTPTRQAEFVARSMAGARWGLSPSSSREMVRQAEHEPRWDILRTLKVPARRGWWDPPEENET